MTEPTGALEFFTEAIAEARDNNLPLDRAEFRQALRALRKGLELAEETASKLPRLACIAIVDDDPEMRRAVERLAKTIGFGEIRSYANCDELRKDSGYCPSSDVPDALITDWDLPDGTGGQVLRFLDKLQEHCPPRSIPYRIIHTSRSAANPESWSADWHHIVDGIVHKGDVIALKTQLGLALAHALKELGRCAST